MSNESNNIKDKLLGMPHGTANNKLRKSIIFWLANLGGMLACYRCKEQIENVDDLSIEHKFSWQMAANPKDAFFDLSNIAFSHLTCNVSSHKVPNKKYDTQEERLDATRKINRDYMRREYNKEDRRDRYLRTGH